MSTTKQVPVRLALDEHRRLKKLALNADTTIQRLIEIGLEMVRGMSVAEVVARVKP